MKKSMGFDEISGGGRLSNLAQVHLKAKNITIRDGKVSVGEYEKWIGPSKVMKISLFGVGIQGLLDQEKEKAAIAGQFKFPSTSGFWPIKVGANLPIPPTPISLFLEMGVGGGGQHLRAGIWYDRARRSRGIKLNPDTKIVEQDSSNLVIFRYELQAKLDFVIDLVAFLFYHKPLYRQNLGIWTLGSYRIARSFRERDGKTDEVKTPCRGAEDMTLGGAIPGQVKLPEENLVKQIAKR
ncbi:hypothetical protein [Tumebacillus algifaecis]|uniref:hypothetical protein n=1 Tax=Tumebacillus algifaecis TaxID=1214604 RepID=UPI0012FD0E2E|nr:hypothetical protein [Tumebacillus algifaecis]